MTPKFPETYIADLYPEKGFMVAGILLIWFIAVTDMIRRLQNKEVDREILSNLGIIFLPALLQMAGAPEVRFFVAVHMIGYFYTICQVKYKEYALMVKQNMIPVVIAFVMFCLLWISVVSSILSSNQYKTLLIDDNNIYKVEESPQTTE